MGCILLYFPEIPKNILIQKASAEISDPDSLSPLISADASFFHLSASSSNQAAPDRHTLSSSIGTGKQRQIPVTGQHLVYCIGI